MKVTIITGGLLIVLLIGGLIFTMVQKSGESDADGSQVLRSSTHVLDDAGADALTVVEFLDFECPSCGAFYPIVEDLREKYEGKITYAVRYFPLPGHVNSTEAALAAEAAAQQGEFEAMYRKLFDTQQQWGHASGPTPEVFREFAQQLGLDLDAYDEAIADPDTAARVAFDFNDGRELGVESTPTFFVDGKQLTMKDWGDLEKAIAAGLDAR